MVKIILFTAFIVANDGSDNNATNDPTTCGMPYTVLVPVFAKEILHGGAHTFGFLMTATGCGALVGTIYLAS